MVSVNLVTPSSRIETRKKVFDDFLDLEPAQEEENRRQRESLKTNAMRDTFKAVTQQPGPAGKAMAGQVTAQAQQQMAGMLPSQALAVQGLAATGAGQQQGMAGSESEQAVTNVQMGLQKGTSEYTRAVAQKAFAAGLDAKKAIFHANSAFSDEAFHKLALDFEQGRVTKKELSTIAQGLKQRLTERKYRADEALREAWAKFKAGLEQKNADGDRRRVLAALELQKQALMDAARAQQIAGIASGALKIGATVAGAMI